MGVVRVVGVVGVVGVVRVVRVVGVGGRAMQLLRIKEFMISMSPSFSANSHNILSVSRTLYLSDQFAISSYFKVNHEYIRSAGCYFSDSLEITSGEGQISAPLRLICGTK